MPSKIVSLAEVTKRLAERYTGETFKNVSFSNAAIDAGLIGQGDVTSAEVIKDNTTVRFAVTKTLLDGDIFVYDDDNQRFITKEIDTYLSGMFIPSTLTDLGISDATATGEYLTSNTNGGIFFSAVDYDSLTNKPPIPTVLTALDDISDGDAANTYLSTDANGTFTFSTIDYTHLNNTPFIPTVLTDLGVSDGNANDVLTTNGSGGFSFLPIPQSILNLGIDDGPANSVLVTDGSGNFTFTVRPIPQRLTDLGIADGSANAVLVTDGGGNFSFTSRPIPQELTDLGIADASANNVLTTDGEGNFIFNTIDYNNVIHQPFIPSTLTDLSISDGSANTVLTTDGSGNFSFSSTIPSSILELGIADGTDGLVLTANGDGTFEFRPMGGTVEYADILNKPSIPADLFDLGVENNVIANSFLTTNGNGDFFFANLQYNLIEGTPSIPATLTDINISDGSANTYLSANNDGTFEFKAIDYSQLQNRPDAELAEKMAILADDAFINAIIFG